MREKKKPELLMPAGSLEVLKTVMPTVRTPYIWVARR